MPPLSIDCSLGDPVSTSMHSLSLIEVSSSISAQGAQSAQLENADHQLAVCPRASDQGRLGTPVYACEGLQSQGPIGANGWAA